MVVRFDFAIARNFGPILQIFRRNPINIWCGGPPQFALRLQCASRPVVVISHTFAFGKQGNGTFSLSLGDVALNSLLKVGRVDGAVHTLLEAIE
jgi:hypothetical protein